MNEQQLLKLAVFTSAAGILVLLYIADSVDYGEKNIADINNSHINQKVEVKGAIVNSKETPGLYIVELKDYTGTINIVIFKEDPLNLQQGQTLAVQGTIVEYRGKLEIIAEEVVT